MKKYFPVYVRVPLLIALFYGLVEYFVDSGDQPAIVKFPELLILIALFVFVLIAIEITASASKSIMNQLMSPEERAERERLENLPLSEQVWFKKMMAKLTKSKSIEDEKSIELDHDYDGIKELDNDLPPWWVYLFYVTIIFGVIYLGKYHLFGGDNQLVELEKDIAKAELEIEEYKKTAPDLLTVENVVYLTEAADLAAGKAIYDQNCVACHAVDGGGGIGPNLTDNHWILGGDIKDIFTTISEGGRDGKGMVPWKAQIKPSDIQKVASYVKSLVGTTPANPKAAEGDLHVEDTSVTETTEEAPATEQPTEEIAS
ncbi:cbb3-type cytochrome c oxidase N-terminal domain-containing protein [Capnocytophaga sp. ARDL2]|uniref:cbb3-type cytochrome c oxidase N-terminal domain-containing protein n=1 Tax=Capnocytophaga sp. ARDL2 TaxID=3238809 RepID=UPI0035588161